MIIQKRFIISTVLVLLISQLSFAQGESYVSLEYQLGFPGKTMKEFVDQPAYSGFQLEFAQLITPYIALGGSFGWNNFYEDTPRQAYQVEDTPGMYYVARKWRQIDAMPVLFKTSFIYENGQVVVPYGSLGIGAYFMRKRSITGPISSDRSSTHFGLRPELGAMFMFGGFGIRTHVAFNGVFNNSRLDAYGMSHWNLGLGVTFAPSRY